MDDLPPPIQVTRSENTLSKKGDDALFEIGAKINNPFAKFFNWLKDFIKKNQNITIKIPIIGLLVAFSSFSLGLGSGYNLGFSAAMAKFFPDSSPLLHRVITVSGEIQKSSSDKFYLKSSDVLWILKSVNPAVDLADYINQQVEIRGNLTKEKSLIEVSDIIPSLISPNTPNTPDLLNQDADLPKLYPNIKWETTQKKVLLFTSGKRRIEQQGVYLESSQVNTIPQDFLDYYTNQLISLGFKQTLNSSDPDGTIITYSKDNLFLTFGIKNIYSGSGDNKQSLRPDGLKKVTGYKAYLEHN